MFENFKTTTLAALAAAATLLGGGQAWAFDTDLGVQQINFGTCTDLYYALNMGASTNNSFVYINGKYAGGVANFSSGATNPQQNIDDATLEDCGFSDVENLLIDGWDHPSDFSQEAFVGFSFTGTDPVTGARNSYRVGLDGVTGTQRVLQITPYNAPPTADAGPDQIMVAGGNIITLDGTGSSDPDPGQTLTYEWIQTEGRAVTLLDPTAAQPTFMTPIFNPEENDATLTFSLIVTDNLGLASVADDVTIVVNRPPVPVLAPTSIVVASGEAVTLDGTGAFDPDPGQTLTYEWIQTLGPPVTLLDATAASTTFTAPTIAAGDHDVEIYINFRVYDNFGLPSLANSLIITVTAPDNQAPTADAGPDQTVSSTAPVTLDGTGSSDPDADQTLTYAWTSPTGVTLSDPTAASPTFTAPTLAAGDPDLTLTFSLTVTDNLGLTSTIDTVTITVVSGVSVVLSGGPEAITDTTPFTVTATFSGPVREFDDLSSDVQVTNGFVRGISGGPAASYTLTIEPTGNGDVTIVIPAGAARLDRDDIEVRNTASDPLRIGNRIVEITQEQIAGFMLGRANNLASNQPGLTRFLQGDGCGAFSANATEGSGAISGCVSNGNTWADITGSWSGDDSYVLGSFGAHGFVNPNLLIGGMLQFDRAEDSANNASGTGYMIGPYFVAQVPDQPLYLEGRLLYGQTDNEISPLGTYTDSFETERWLAQLRATGEYQVQNTTLMPLLDFTYTDDTQKAYTDNLGNTIPGQTVSLMQLSAGMDFSTPLPVSTGALDLTGGFSGIYSSSDGAAAAPEFENWRGRTHLGLNYGLPNGATLSATTFYDGLGTDYESYGASLGFDMKF